MKVFYSFEINSNEVLKLSLKELTRNRVTHQMFKEAPIIKIRILEYYQLTRVSDTPIVLRVTSDTSTGFSSDNETLFVLKTGSTDSPSTEFGPVLFDGLHYTDADQINLNFELLDIFSNLGEINNLKCILELDFIL